MVDFSELHKRLKEEQFRLNDELRQSRARMRTAGERREGSPFGKREEAADEASEFEKGLALDKRMTDALADVEHALEKYEAGSYGICDICGQSIEPARLEALPQASLCLACKTRQTKNVKNRPAHQ